MIIALSRLNISLPESMRSFVDDRKHRLGYTTVSEYFRELIRRDQKLAAKPFDERFKGYDTPRISGQPLRSPYRHALFGDED